MLLRQDALDFADIQEAFHLAFLDIDLHLRAMRLLCTGFVKRGDGEQQVGGDKDVADNDGGFLPVDGRHISLFDYLLFNILVICGT